MKEIRAERPTHKYQPHIYAGASGDFNPIHIDPEFAKAVGFERNIIHGLCTMAFAAKAVVDEAGGGDPRSLKRLRVRFASPLLVEDSVKIAGAERTDEEAVTFALEAENDQGQKVLSRGQARVER